MLTNYFTSIYYVYKIDSNTPHSHYECDALSMLSQYLHSVFISHNSTLNYILICCSKIYN